MTSWGDQTLDVCVLASPARIGTKVQKLSGSRIYCNVQKASSSIEDWILNRAAWWPWHLTSMWETRGGNYTSPSDLNRNCALSSKGGSGLGGMLLSFETYDLMITPMSDLGRVDGYRIPMW